jgi:ATP-dependent helicase HrpB
VETLARERVLVLEAPPGAGKTTRVPRALLDAGLDRDREQGGEIIVLEPRRLAARMAARRVAEELGEPVGETVGYQVRFEDVTSKKTQIRFVTEGVLTRRLLSDPTLARASCVLLDEFHERHVHADIALALLRRLQRTVRPELRIVAMSATLATEPVAAYLGARAIRTEGRSHEVRIEYANGNVQDDRPLASQVASAVRALASAGIDGHMLVFLPGAGEIRKAKETCERLAAQFDLLILPLHGDLSAAEQDRVLRPTPQRKVILATNVAESSVTIDGVVAVIDSGLARVATHSPWSGVSSLRVAKISRASATQRAGRAGRTRPGVCVRLYTKADFESRAEHDVAEIRRVDLAQTLLELAAAGIRDVDWFEAPTEGALSAARELLVALEAVDDAGRVTDVGRRMLRFPLHPRHARVLVEAERRGVVEDGVVLAALLSEGDIRSTTRTRFDGAARGHRGHDGAIERSDLLALVDLFREAEYAEFRREALARLELDVGATLAVERARKQLARLVDRRNAPPSLADKSEDALLVSVLAGFPDRVAKRLRPGGRAFSLARGGSAELSEASAVHNAPFVVAVDAEERAKGQVLVRLASAIEPEWLLDLFAERIVESTAVVWNDSAERVEATNRMAYGAVALDESPAAATGGPEIARLLARKAIERGLHTFAPEGAFERFVARIRFAATLDSAITPPTDETLEAMLTRMCEGKRSFAELREVSLVDALRGELQGANVTRLERLAPAQIPLPSGRSCVVHYEEGKPPWVESYLQDFFGTLTTPRVGDGRVPLVVHLLAPNRRAVQVTTDLEGFWAKHYPGIRKELMRKYPKHNWPEDPKTAAARVRR